MPAGRYTPAYVAPEEVPPPVEPGMYEPIYTGPGQYAAPAPTPPVPTESGYTEPGMYDQPYQEPGQAVPWRPPVEPGMYEPHYIQPGYYTPRSASTYYGGQLFPTPFTGVERYSPTTTPGPLSSTVQVNTPSTGETTYRPIPFGGTVVNEGTKLPDTIAPGATSRGEVFGNMAGGGIAPPTGVATVGPTASQLGYRYQQGDPGVVMRPRIKGDTPMPVRRSDLDPPIADQLKGLYGGGEQKSSQVMPLPPGSRRPRLIPRRRP